MEDTPIHSPRIFSRRPEFKTTTRVALGAGIALALYFLFFSAPLSFPVGQIVEIEPGSSLRGVSLVLKQNKFIRSRIAFESLVIIFGTDKQVISANYYFENKLPVYVLAYRISKGKHNLAPVAVTVPEGFDREQIADAFEPRLENFDKDKFLLATIDLEGYLFPDTYFFLTTDTETEVIKSMQNNFSKKIGSIREEIDDSDKGERDIIIMASIIEREAKGDDDRALISGILWKRLSIGMPLQVDAAPETYKKKGLTDKPICNPGLESIKAAIYPKKSSYLYYLHDPEGEIHYANTYTEHQANIKKYLK